MTLMYVIYDVRYPFFWLTLYYTLTHLFSCVDIVLERVMYVLACINVYNINLKYIRNTFILFNLTPMINYYVIY